MNKRQVSSIFIIVLIGVIVLSFFMLKSAGRLPFDRTIIRNVIVSIDQSPMKLTSIAFNHQQPIPKEFTCDGRDVNPPLEIADVPTGTKSLVLIVDDPDAPKGDWVHWLVWNISPTTTAIATSTVPAGASQGTTDFERAGWGGPCPPTGTHRYVFKLYALDVMLDIPESTRKSGLELAIQGHIAAKAELIGTYKR